ncbi:MAG: hypothetical protein JJU41_01520 [Bacteroidetes bacterium]|nr:hypothetical protein [Bacteroidota bacterium]MCH8522933.1 hypothetical protein [Balneolales bacterium]
MKQLLIISLTALWLFSCTDNSGNTSEPTDGNLLILNEGAFGQGNASISLWNPETRELSHNVFASRNAPRVLGDVLQSAVHHNDEIYLVVNNSRRIEVIDVETFVSKRTITFSGQASPRYLAITQEGKGYVSSLFTDYVYVVDLADAIVTDSVFVGSGTEGIIYSNNHIFVAKNLNSDFSTASGIAVIRTSDQVLLDVLETGPGPQAIVKNSGTLWVNLAGTWGGDNGGLVQINPAERTIMQEINLDRNTSGLASSNSSSFIYLLSNGINKINTINTSDVITISENRYYAISVGINDDIVYAFDARNFAQAGMMYVYENPLQIADSVRTGFVPRGILSLQNQ